MWIAGCASDDRPDAGEGGATSTSTGASSSSQGAAGQGSSGTTTPSSSHAGGSGGDGGDGGSGGSGGDGGAGGDGTSCEVPRARLAAGTGFTCAATPLSAGGELRCRGGRFGEGWVAPDGGDEPPRCVEHVVAGERGACYRTAAGEGCPAPRVTCDLDGAITEVPWSGEGAPPLPVLVEGGFCLLAADGSADCRGGAPTPPDLAAIAPLGGAEGGPHDACAWGAGGIRCWGATPSVARDVPRFAGCPADVDVSDGFACTTYAGFDVVDCWGERPPLVEERSFLPGPGMELAVGSGFVCVRTDTGLVRCWGDDATGALGVAGDASSASGVEPTWPAEAPEALGLAASETHVALMAEGPAGAFVLGWGENDVGQICSCAESLVETPTDAEHPLP